MTIVRILVQAKTDNAPNYVSSKMKQFFSHYNIKHNTGNHTILQDKESQKDLMHFRIDAYKTKRKNKGPQGWINIALLTFNFLNINEAITGRGKEGGTQLVKETCSARGEHDHVLSGRK